MSVKRPAESSRYLEAMCMVWVLSAIRTNNWNQAFKMLRKQGGRLLDLNRLQVVDESEKTDVDPGIEGIQFPEQGTPDRHVARPVRGRPRADDECRDLGLRESSASPPRNCREIRRSSFQRRRHGPIPLAGAAMARRTVEGVGISTRLDVLRRHRAIVWPLGCAY